MADYSGMKSNMEENKLHYFTFSTNSEKPIMTAIRHLPPDTPAEDTSNNLEDLGFNVISVRQMTGIRRAPNGQTHMETLLLLLVTATRNTKSQVECHNHNIIKVDL
jgi:hypothetical protein